ncbi:MAG: C39 family peptidase [Candidatus Margulisbacteria bacterium]|nr:C39 family peptidase [Candidatus Margulisiibacteriota bacterium]
MRVLIALLLLSMTAFALPAKVYLPIPFLCQAPYANWAQPWQDACEEAAIIMAIHYINRYPLDKASGNQEILGLVKFQEKRWGGHHDLTAAQSVKLLKDYYKYNDVELSYRFGIEDIKDELAKGNVVLAPMAGRLLGNPYYTRPGPAYHYMVFKGYDDGRGEFITNDSGTKRGENYRYKYQVAFNAIHDWAGSKETITQGKKALIVVKSKQTRL